MNFLKNVDRLGLGEFQRAVYEAACCIPRGKVASYQTIAFAITRPRAARAVGNALHDNPFGDVPCHRVVCGDGRIGGFARGKEEKIKILREEGVKIFQERVDTAYLLHKLAK